MLFGESVPLFMRFFMYYLDSDLASSEVTFCYTAHPLWIVGLNLLKNDSVVSVLRSILFWNHNYSCVLSVCVGLYAFKSCLKFIGVVLWERLILS